MLYISTSVTNNTDSWDLDKNRQPDSHVFSNGTEAGANSTEVDSRYNVFSALSVASYTVIAVGIPGNLLVIASILRNKHLRTVPNILVLSLSACDILFLSIVVPVHAQTFRTRQWNTFPELCWTIALISNLLIGSSILNTGAIALNRYIAIVLSHKYIYWTRTRIMVCTFIFVYLFPFILMLPVISGQFGRFDFDSQDKYCGRQGGQTFLIVSVSALVVIPLILMTLCYIHILIHVFASRRRVGVLRNAWAGQNRSTETKLTTMLASVYVVYLVTTLPALIVKILKGVGVGTPWYSNIITFYILWTSSAINPIVYGLVNKKYREAYTKVLKKLVVFSAESRTEILSVALQTSSPPSAIHEFPSNLERRRSISNQHRLAVPMPTNA